MKIALTILIVVAALIISGVLIAGPQLQSVVMRLKPEPKALEVRTQLVEGGALTVTVSAPGEIEPHTQVIIYAEVSARIEALPFDEGDMVRKGEVIVKLDDRDLKAALASRKANREESKFRIESERASIAGLRSDLEFAERTLARQQALHDSGDISLSQLDDARQRVEEVKSRIDASLHTISVMESTLAAAEANIARAERDLDNTIIRAPMDGVITVLEAEVGEAVLGMVSNMGTRIMTIADLSRMVMKAKVPEGDIAEVRQAQNARIHVNAYPDDVFSGTVTRIALQRTSDADGTGFFETEIEIDLRGRQLRSGLNANVDIEIATHDGPKVESQAIVERVLEELPDELVRDHPLIDRTRRTVSAVYLMVNGKAAFTPVKPGPSDLTHTIVDKGLAVGDRVVIGPYKVLEVIKHDDFVRDPALAGDKAPAGGEALVSGSAPKRSSNAGDESAAAAPAGSSGAGS